MRFVYFWFLKTGEKKRSKITMEKKIQLWHQWNHHTLQFMCYCVHLDQQSVDQRRCHVVDDTVGRNWKKRWFNYLSQFNGFTTYQKIKSKYFEAKESECNRVYGNHCSLTFLFLLPLSNLFHCLCHVPPLYLKQPKQVFFNPIKYIFEHLLHTLYLLFL